MIHGIRNGLGFIGKYHTLIDWTQGCVAVANNEIQEIYNSTFVGTKVEILP
jgi:murein L,D-transpeptidase YafK